MTSIFQPRNVIVQGITGRHGAFHTQRMYQYGTPIIAGTSPTKAGTEVDGIPVYASVADVKQSHGDIDATVIFVPAAHAKAAVFEAIDAEIPLIICITEHIPVHDMLQIKQHIAGKPSILIGPNCPGILTPDHALLGLIPANLALPGSTAIVSRSGTLTYEAMDLLTRRGIGQKYIVGIGGDMIPGSSFQDILALFEADPEVDRIVMIGEIGGTSEIAAARYIRDHITKPVYAYVAGHTAPVGVQLGHAGAILGTDQLETAIAKSEQLAQAGATVRSSIGELIQSINQ